MFQVLVSSLKISALQDSMNKEREEQKRQLDYIVNTRVSISYQKTGNVCNSSSLLSYGSFTAEFPDKRERGVEEEARGLW